MSPGAKKVTSARRVLNRLWHLAAAVVVVPIAWVLAKLVKFGDWAERKQIERRQRKSNLP